MVVLLAKTLSGPLERAVAATQLPMSFVGVIVAGIVLLPEAIAAMKAARANHLQISLNLALGSALATTALTIPIVGAVALYLTRPLVLGLDPTSMVLLLLTLFISTITLATGRTTILQGAVHVAIFVIFLLLSMLP
jgi:Ca2+:H+ antiporter